MRSLLPSLPLGMSTDYVKWVEHRAAKTCLLGYKYTFNLTSSSSM